VSSSQCLWLVVGWMDGQCSIQVYFNTKFGGRVDQSKVLFGVKKEGNQRDFFVVKGIIGQRYYKAESIKRIDNWSKRIDSVTLVNPSHVLYCQSQFAVKANELTEGKSPLNFAMVIAAQGINGYLSVSAIT
jgi:hypothetical protein